ncbi:MAG: hypothetical protein PHZ07_00260 [Patescibacteria group bacterium]|nr:hypothetical protein [Patescibacteria group bacterium]MDD4304159.1 hypothetical protein [Patescibacteria group bacterium]MDD4695190.1 hypothetical protein [Patescibacteria group bacterium]
MDILSGYPKEEVAFILGYNGLKIGHEKEFRYDILAKIISVYKLLKEHKDEIREIIKTSPERENYDPKSIIRDSDRYIKDLSVFLGSLEGLSEEYKQMLIQLSELEIKEPHQKEQIAILKKSIKEYLKTNPNDNNTKINLNKFKGAGLFQWEQRYILNSYSGIAKQIKNKKWYDDSKFPEFYYIQDAGKSFGVKDEDNDYFDFREFYSSYKEDISPEDLNQIVSKSGWQSFATFFALNRETQTKYFNSQIKPLLENYYLATSINKNQAIERYKKDSKNFSTFFDVILFIQKNIISKSYYDSAHGDKNFIDNRNSYDFDGEILL